MNFVDIIPYLTYENDEESCWYKCLNIPITSTLQLQ
jgi:hypothetical protein